MNREEFNIFRHDDSPELLHEEELGELWHAHVQLNEKKYDHHKQQSEKDETKLLYVNINGVVIPERSAKFIAKKIIAANAHRFGGVNLSRCGVSKRALHMLAHAAAVTSNNIEFADSQKSENQVSTTESSQSIGKKISAKPIETCSLSFAYMSLGDEELSTICRALTIGCSGTASTSFFSSPPPLEDSDDDDDCFYEDDASFFSNHQTPRARYQCCTPSPGKTGGAAGNGSLLHHARPLTLCLKGNQLSVEGISQLLQQKQPFIIRELDVRHNPGLCCRELLEKLQEIFLLHDTLKEISLDEDVYQTILSDRPTENKLRLAISNNIHGNTDIVFSSSKCLLCRQAYASTMSKEGTPLELIEGSPDLDRVELPEAPEPRLCAPQQLIATMSSLTTTSSAMSVEEENKMLRDEVDRLREEITKLKSEKRQKRKMKGKKKIPAASTATAPTNNGVTPRTKSVSSRPEVTSKENTLPFHYTAKKQQQPQLQRNTTEQTTIPPTTAVPSTSSCGGKNLLRGNTFMAGKVSAQDTGALQPKHERLRMMNAPVTSSRFVW